MRGVEPAIEAVQIEAGSAEGHIGNAIERAQRVVSGVAAQDVAAVAARECVAAAPAGE